MCYRKAEPPEVTEIVDLKDHVSKLDNSFFLVDTRQKRNTKELVAGVNKMKENEPA
jgi:mevalonate kinase